jgi:hypothetical protein
MSRELRGAYGAIRICLGFATTRRKTQSKPASRRRIRKGR